jgi:hypothetical protein
MLLPWLDGDEPGTAPGKLRAFGIILGLVVCAEYWTKGLTRSGEQTPGEIAALVVVTLLTAAVVQGRWRRAGPSRCSTTRAPRSSGSCSGPCAS